MNVLELFQFSQIVLNRQVAGLAGFRRGQTSLNGFGAGSVDGRNGFREGDFVQVDDALGERADVQGVGHAREAGRFDTGSVKIEAGAAGKVFKLEKSVGDAVKKGDSIMVLEIMKMETPVVATQDGTVASINVSVGDMVEAGALLATLN